MKRFLLHTGLFLLLMLVALIVILSRAECRTDEFYCRFTSSAQKSMILGTSRAAQGLNPDELNKHLGRDDMFNYSFTNEHSPYGKVYFESVQRKLAPGSEGIFILSVDPWCLGADKSDPNNESLFRENDLMLDGMWDVNSSPNFLYLLKYYDGSYYDLVMRHWDNQLMLQENGWLKVNVPTDSASVLKRTKERIRIYREETAPNYALSDVRFSYLEKIIDLLSNHGEKVLVRLPVSREMLLLEDEYFPQFNERLKAFADKNNVLYIDMTSESGQFKYTDGNHLAQESVPMVCKMLADRIKAN